MNQSETTLRRLQCGIFSRQNKETRVELVKRNIKRQWNFSAPESGHIEFYCLNGYYGILKGPIYTYVPPEHPVIAIWNNGIQKAYSSKGNHGNLYIELIEGIER